MLGDVGEAFVRRGDDVLVRRFGRRRLRLDGGESTGSAQGTFGNGEQDERATHLAQKAFDARDTGLERRAEGVALGAATARQAGALDDLTLEAGLAASAARDLFVAFALPGAALEKKKQEA